MATLRSAMTHNGEIRFFMLKPGVSGEADGAGTGRGLTMT
jgi:hypothetical protein